MDHTGQICPSGRESAEVASSMLGVGPTPAWPCPRQRFSTESLNCQVLNPLWREGESREGSHSGPLLTRGGSSTPILFPTLSQKFLWSSQAVSVSIKSVICCAHRCTGIFVWTLWALITQRALCSGPFKDKSPMPCVCIHRFSSVLILVP